MPEAPLPNSPATHSNEGQSGIAVMVRLCWMFLGNIALVIFALKIAQSPGVPAADIAFWSIAGAMVVLRLIDIKFLRGQTTNGVRATERDWWRYLASMTGAASALWVLGHTLLRGLLA